MCDHVIVMSAKTSAALCAGLRDGGMSEDRIHVVDTLDEATALLQRLSQPGDVVLFANDLPDTYLPAARGSTRQSGHSGVAWGIIGPAPCGLNVSLHVSACVDALSPTAPSTPREH